MKYPLGQRNYIKTSSHDTSRRGMSLESDINAACQYYLDLDKANIHKKPTPITIVKVDYPSRNKAKITEAYFKVPSTTDYNGIYRGYYIDFEAKECRSKTSFPFSSIHPSSSENFFFSREMMTYPPPKVKVLMVRVERNRTQYLCFPLIRFLRLTLSPDAPSFFQRPEYTTCLLFCKIL